MIFLFDRKISLKQSNEDCKIYVLIFSPPAQTHLKLNEGNCPTQSEKSELQILQTLLTSQKIQNHNNSIPVQNNMRTFVPRTTISKTVSTFYENRRKVVEENNTLFHSLFCIRLFISGIDRNMFSTSSHLNNILKLELLSSFHNGLMLRFLKFRKLHQLLFLFNPDLGLKIRISYF